MKRIITDCLFTLMVGLLLSLFNPSLNFAQTTAPKRAAPKPKTVQAKNTTKTPAKPVSVLQTNRPLSAAPNPQTATAPDSVVANFPAGKPFLFLLPKGAKSGGKFQRYEVIDAPAYSWLVNRSFFWDTERENIGVKYIKFRAYTKEEEAQDIVIAVQVVQ